MQRWSPRCEVSKKEALLLKRLKRTRKLFAFLRLHRADLFDDDFQSELELMYRDTGAGNEPVPPAQLCMALILQGYMGVSDADAVELSIVDARWQMVLDCLGAEEPAFGQGTLQRFRQRLVAADMDRRLLERTRELAKNSNAFDWKKLPKDLRVGVDSRPLLGAGRVEDTFNLLGHAARKLVETASYILGEDWTVICHAAGIPLLLHPSIKAGLDIDWRDPLQKDAALEMLVQQVTSLNGWLEETQLSMQEPLRPYIKAIAQVHEQDLEEAAGKVRLRQGVAPDRRISIEDSEMRHGRKSKTKRFDGYKEHVAADLDTDLILACAITPANVPEEEAAPELQSDLDCQGVEIRELSVDRAYINSTLVELVEQRGGEIICKPWSPQNRRNLFTKMDFKIDMRSKTITCPNGEIERFEPGQTVEFEPDACSGCTLRSQCTYAASGRGRTVHISQDEQRQHRLRKLQASNKGRARIRGRTGIEHRLAHIAARKGPRARYLGVRKNLFDLRRAATIQNLETLHRVTTAAHNLAA